MMLLKRILDILASLTALIILMPFLLFLALAIRIKLGSPVLFTQVRPGYKGRLFKMVKFRSMSDARDSAGDLLSDAERLGQFGRLLRSSSLDELPELWNVLKGEMSLVGPRPLLVEYLPLYSKEQMRRHDVRPGITGWAQINGRNAITWDEKFNLDIWYVDHATMMLDLKIIRLTVMKVFVRDGIQQQGSITAEKFKGSREKL